MNSFVLLVKTWVKRPVFPVFSTVFPHRVLMSSLDLPLD
jgi:hypothetical protein